MHNARRQTQVSRIYDETLYIGDDTVLAEHPVVYVNSRVDKFIFEHSLKRTLTFASPKKDESECLRFATVTVNPTVVCSGTSIFTLDNEDSDSAGRRLTLPSNARAWIVDDSYSTSGSTPRGFKMETADGALRGTDTVFVGWVGKDDQKSPAWSVRDEASYLKYLLYNAPKNKRVRVSRQLCDRVCEILPFEKYFQLSEAATDLSDDEALTARRGTIEPRERTRTSDLDLTLTTYRTFFPTHRTATD